MIPFFFSLLMATGAFAGDSTPAGCDVSGNFSADAYKVWIAEGTKQTASEDGAGSKSIPVSKRAELLLNSAGVGFRGFVKFQIPSDGTYVIATDAYPRIDITDIATGDDLSPDSFGKIRDCGTVSKALRFQFKKDSKFQLELVSSQSANLNVLIWKLN